MITYRKWTDHLGFIPDTIALVANGDEKFSAEREGTKGPVLPAARVVSPSRVHPYSLPFENSGS